MVMIANKAIHWEIYSGCDKEDGRRGHENMSVSDFLLLACIRLTSSSRFTEKRIGYLSVALMLDENEELLTLAQNTIRKDLEDYNPHVQGLALLALANFSTPDMLRDLFVEIERLMTTSSPYIQKKAIICALRAVRKVPELCSPLVVEKVAALLAERNHGVLVSALSLAIELAEMSAANTEILRSSVPVVVKLMKGLTLSSFGVEHEVGGIPDPFLQVKAIHLLSALAKDSPPVAAQISDVLASVATNTEIGRTAANAVLYECCVAIMSLDGAKEALRSLAVNLLGRFLSSRDHNSRYVALNALSRAIEKDIQAVSKHRPIIVECLKDPDISIRRRALDLIYALVNAENVRLLVPELLNYLTSNNEEFVGELTSRICDIVERLGPSPRWHVDVMAQVLKQAGRFVKSEPVVSLVAVITNAPEEVQQYATQRLFAISRELPSILTAPPRLFQVTTWCMGEFAHLLVKKGTLKVIGTSAAEFVPPTENDVISFLETLSVEKNLPTVVRQMSLFSLAKLPERLSPAVLPRIEKSLSRWERCTVTELQGRALELLRIVRNEKLRKTILCVMPPMKSAACAVATSGSAASKEGASEDKKLPPSVSLGAPTISTPAASAAAPLNADVLLNLAPDSNLMDELLGLSVGQASALPVASSSGPASFPVSAAVPSAAMPMERRTSGPAVQPAIDIATSGPLVTDPFGAAPPSPSAALPPAVAASVEIYNRNGLTIVCDGVKSTANPMVTDVRLTFRNSLALPMENFVFQAAVPTYLKMNLKPLSSRVIPARQLVAVVQEIAMENTTANSPQPRPLMLRIRMEWSVGDVKSGDQVEVKKIPVTA